MTRRKLIFPGEAKQGRKLITPKTPERAPGMDFLHKIGEALGGGAAGLAHGASETGANIAQFPFDVYSWATGKPGFQVPRADLKQYAPDTPIGQGAATAGEFAAPFLLSPALAAESGAGRALFSKEGAGFLRNMAPRLGLDALLGSAESENRRLGALGGALAPAAGKAIKFARETPLTKLGAAKNLEKARKLAGEEPIGIPLSGNFIRDMEYQMLSPHVRPSKLQLTNLMAEASKGTYPAYHDMQSALGDVSRELLHPTSENQKGILGAIASLFHKPETSAAERLTGQQLEKIRSQYIKDAMEHLTKTGKKNVADLEMRGRKEYSNYKRFIPYRNAIIGSALGGVPGFAYLKHILNHD
jgi:hypothetical protein